MDNIAKRKDGACDNKKSDIDGITESIDKMVISDDKLFADPPPKEECPICMLPMPRATGICGVPTTYYPCCGKTLCYGCEMAANVEIKRGNMKDCCAFCREPFCSNREFVKRLKKRIKLNDANAFYMLAGEYEYGGLGLPKDSKKSLESTINGAKLGSLDAHSALGDAYIEGSGVGKNMKKAIHHYKVAAIGGHEMARHNLGVLEQRKNKHKAMKHYIIAARCGYDDSLKQVGEGYKAGLVTKEEYANTLRAYQASLDEMKSEQRSVSEKSYNIQVNEMGASDKILVN